MPANWPDLPASPPDDAETNSAGNTGGTTLGLSTGPIEPQGVLNDLIRQRAPDLADNGNVDPQAVLNRLIRRQQDKMAERAAKTPEGQPDFSAFGTTKDKVQSPDFSQFGTPENEAVAAGEVPVNDIGSGPSVAAREAAQSAVKGVGSTLKGLGVAATAQAQPSPPGEADINVPENVPVGKQPSAKESSLYRAGQATEKWAEENIPVSEAERAAHPIYSKTGQILGGVAAPLALGMVDPAAGIAGGAAMFGFSSAGDTYDAAIEKGASEDTAREAAMLSGAANAALGTLPIASVLAPFKKLLPEGAGLGMRILSEAAQNGVVFASVGEAQEYIGQQIAKMYDPKAGYSFNTERLISELLAGGALGTLHAALEKHQAAKPELKIDTEDDLRNRGDAEPEPQPGLPPGSAGAQQGFTDANNPKYWQENGSFDYGKYQQDNPGYDRKDDPNPWQSTGPNASAGAGGAGAQQSAPKEKPQPFETKLKPSVRLQLEDAAAYYKEHDRDTIRSWSDDELKDYVNRKFGYGSHRADDDEILRRQGHTDEDIKGMSPEEKAANVDEALRNGTPSTEEPPAPGSRGAPIDIKTGADVERASRQASQDHTHAQGEANNAERGHATWQGLGVTFEAPAGGIRRGVSAEGMPWEQRFSAAYGYIKGTKGADGDHLDAFFGANPGAPTVYVIDERDPKTGAFRQHKAFIGFQSPMEALKAYTGAQGKEETGVGGMRAMSVPEFKDWAKGDLSQPLSDAMYSVKPDVKPAEEGANNPKTGAREADLTPEERQNPSAAQGGSVVSSGPETSPRDHAAVEAALKEVGVDPHQVRPVDIARAAEIHANEGLPPADAFQLAVVRAAVEDGLMTPEQVKEQYGEEIHALLEPAGAPALVVPPAASSAAARGETAAPAGEQLRGGGAARPQEPHQRAGEAAEGPKTEGTEGAEHDNGEAAGGEAGEHPVREPAGGERAAEAAAEQSGQGNAVEAGNAAQREHAENAPRVTGGAPFAGMVENAEEYRAAAKKRRESGQEGTVTTFKSHRAEEAARHGRTVTEANEERAKLVAEHEKKLKKALKQAKIGRDEVPDEIWNDAIGRMIDHGHEPIDAIDAAFLKAEHDAVVFEAEESEAATERQEAVSETKNETAHGGGAQLPQAGEKSAGEAPAISEGGEARSQAGERSGSAERGTAAGGEQPSAERERQPSTERTAAGQQHVLPGAERISDAELAQRRADERLKPKVNQKPADEGLFGDEHKQTDLVEQARAPETPKVKREGEIEAADTGEPMTVKLTDKGPWDFNDTFPAPNEKKLAAYEEQRGPIFGEANEDGSYDASQVAGMLDETINSMVNDQAVMRRAGRLRAEIKSGKTKPPGRTPPEKYIKQLTRDIQEAARAFQDTASELESFFDPEAVTAMKREARARVIQEEKSTEWLPEAASKQLEAQREEWTTAPTGAPPPSATELPVDEEFQRRFKQSLDKAFGPREDDRAAAIASEDAAEQSAEETAKATESPRRRTARKVAKSAAENLGGSAEEAMQALTKLFGGGKTVGAGPAFDPETYQQAKPHFIKAASRFSAFLDDIYELMDRMIGELKDAYGWSREMLEGVQPYVQKFIEEVKAGKITREDLAGERPGDKFKEEAPDERAGTQSAGERPLAEVAPAEVSGGAGERNAERGSRGRGEPGAKGNRSPQGERVPGARGERKGAEGLRAAAARSGRARRGAEGRAAPDGSGLSEGPASASRIEPNVPEQNFRIREDLGLGKGGETQKFNDNLTAIAALKNIERDERRATPDEQRILARYVGWGGLANAFRSPQTDEFKPDWAERGNNLESLLTKDELRAARRTTLNAHYTSKPVIDAMWKAVEHLGFKGGLTLESSMGPGNFLGLVPDHLAAHTKFIGVEFDSLTARIAKLLYPQETVLHSGFQRVPMPDGEFVLSIGNPPFGSESLRFQYKPALAGLSIHNQFFLAALDALQPGGLHAAVVSRYLLDARDSSAREKMAVKADLLGAIRLPDTAFKENARTEVVTDIVFMRRRTAEDEKAIENLIADMRQPGKGKAADEARQAARETLLRMAPWIDTDEVKDPLGGEPMSVNSYFASNPKMVMGRLERSGTMQRAGEEGKGVNVTLDKNADLGALLDKAIGTLPKDAINLSPDIAKASIERHKSMSDALKIALAGHETGHIEFDDKGQLTQIAEKETPSGGFEATRRALTPESPWSRQLLMDREGKWYTLEPAVNEKGEKLKQGKRNVYERKYFPNNDVPAGMRLGQAKFERLSDLARLRDLTKKQIVLETEDADAKRMEANRRLLATAYKSYTGKNGLLNEPRNAALVNEMPDGALLAALESGYRPPITPAKAARTGDKPRAATATPAAILSRRVIPKYEAPTSAKSPADALSISLSERGKIDLPRVATLLGVSEEEAAAKLGEGDKPLAFFNPETNEWEPRNDYLSGQVRRKLAAAITAGLEKNITELEAVQPERWTAEQVTALPGANWIPPKIYEDYAEHLLGAKGRVNYSKATNSFNLLVGDYGQDKQAQWGTDDMPADAILRGMLNSRIPKVIREDAKKNRYEDKEASALVVIKAKEIQNDFADWVFADTDRRNQLVDIYNDKFNTRVTRQHDGSHLTLPGKVPDEVIKMRRHQKNAIWRGIYERFMLLDHVVGAGKTFTAIARAMERRRMGLSRKPMVTVPNHLVDQWAADTYRLYPGAKVLAAGKNQFDKQNRRRLFAKIATGDWDLVIVPHSSFGFIGISPDTELRFLDEELRVAQDAVREAQEEAEASGIGGGRKPFTVKEAERLVTTIETRMDSLRSKNRDNMLTFEQMGVDDLTVDEAHEFKNLFYSSRLQGVRGMGDKHGSRKAFDLYNKVRVLRESPTGTVTFMTGTPISNSAVEMYTMMRYLAARDLHDLGLEHFDAWRAQSVSAEPKWEPTEAGGLKEVTRLGRSWSNMRALMELYYSFTDAVSQDDINRWYAEDNGGARFPVPEVKGGGRQEIIVKPTRAQQTMLEEIVAAFNDLPNIKDPDERNATRLRLMDKARKLSLDVRAINTHTVYPGNEKGGKVDVIADNVARLHKAWGKDKGTQLVFLDRSVPKSKGDDRILKEYDGLVAKRDAALTAGDEATYREITDHLEKYHPAEMEELRQAQKGGWNAYDQLKKNLIARGIPADEVRFIQEASSDAEKKAIFDAVNDGLIRVLIGSTARMGAGTNVQERIVGLHHGDVTWKPSDIEQREGRGIRQGNRLLEKYGDKFALEILAYATERTVDAKMWDLNSQKLKMVNGIRKYNGAFNMEFEDDDSVSMAEIAALASGDPLLLERVKLGGEIEKIEMQERAYRRKMFGIEDAITSAERAIRDYPAKIEEEKLNAAEVRSELVDPLLDAVRSRSITIEGKKHFDDFSAEKAAADAIATQKGGDENAPYTVNIEGAALTNKTAIEEAIRNAFGDTRVPFEMTMGGETFRRRWSAGKAIAEKVKPALDSVKNNETKVVPLGRMFDTDVSATVQGESTSFADIVLAVTKGGRTLAAISGRTERSISPNRIQAALEKLSEDIMGNARSTGAWMQQRIDEAKRTLPSLKAQRGEGFPLAGELKTMRERLAAIVAELDRRTKEAEGRRGGAAEPQEAEPEGDLLAPMARPALAAALTPKAAPLREDLARRLTAIVQHLTGRQVAVDIRGRYAMKPIGWGHARKEEVGGAYLPMHDIIRLALNHPSINPLDAAYHESWHAIEDHFVTDAEMRLLKAQEPRLREMAIASMKQEAPSATDAQVRKLVDKMADYEIRAEAFTAFMKDREGGGYGAGLHIGIRALFERLRRLFQQIANYLRGLGFNSYHDVFEQAAAGDLAARPSRKAEGAPSRMADQIRAEQARTEVAARIEHAEEGPQAAMARPAFDDPLHPASWSIRRKIADLIGSEGMLWTKEHFQDWNARVERMQNAVEARSNDWVARDRESPLPDDQQFYQLKRLFPGKRASRMQTFMTEYFRPLADTMRIGHIGSQEAGDYVYAKHAPERNDNVGRLHQPGSDFYRAVSDHDVVGASGMSTNDARRIAFDLEHGPKGDAFRELAQRVGEIRRFISSEMIRGGLESQETISEWWRSSPNYVPLRGWEDPTNAPQFAEQRPKGYGGDIKGPETQRALGRRSKADNPVVALVDQALRTIDRAEKNLALHGLARMLNAAGAEVRKELGITIDRGRPKRMIDRSTGLVKWTDDSYDQRRENAVHMKVRGRDQYVVFDDLRLARAVKMWSPKTNAIIQIANHILGKWKSLLTHYNPEFMARHAARYFVEGLLNAYEQKEHGNFSALQYMTDAFPFIGNATRAIWNVEHGRDGGPLGDYWKQMKEGGGAMSMFSMREYDQMLDRLRKKAASIGRSEYDPRELARAISETVDMWTSIIDNSTRLSAFVQARQAGKSIQQASMTAREATVDYNLRGVLSNYLALWEPFQNVATQTGYRMGAAQSRSRIMRKVFFYTMAMGFGAAAWNYAFGGQDKDKIAFFDKLPEWTKTKQLALFIGLSDEKGRPQPIQFPFPFNYAFPLTLGYAAAGMIFGTEKAATYAAQAIKSLISAISPIGETGVAWRDIAPEQIKPLMDIGLNKSWTGGHIHTTTDMQKGPNAESGFKWTPSAWKDIAKFLNNVSGGNRTHSGYLDFYPEDIAYIMKEYFGGQVRTIENAAKVFSTVGQGQPIVPSDIPVGRVFYGTDYDKANQAIARERKIESKHPWEGAPRHPEKPLMDLGHALGLNQ
jgi:N12 class adenine-specific DNA methylase